LEITAGDISVLRMGERNGLWLCLLTSQSFSLSYTRPPTFAAAASLARRQKNLTTSCTADAAKSILAPNLQDLSVMSRNF
jgi:hypothetical protein